MKKHSLLILTPFILASCTAAPVMPDTPAETAVAEESRPTAENTEENMKLTIDEATVKVSWEENESVSALEDIVRQDDLIIPMSMYGGFEQVGPLGTILVRNDVQTVTSSGDIVLYSGNQIVVFYGSNTWAYTRLGHITDKTPEEMKQLLGNGDVTVTITMGEKYRSSY